MLYSFISETNYCKNRKKIMKKMSIHLIILFSLQHILQINASTSSLPIINRFSRNSLSPDLFKQAEESKLSILKPSDADIKILYQNYPDGSVLFPKNSDVSSRFNNLIAVIKANPSVIEFLRKVHITALNQLYAYLMKIYTNFNLTNPGCLQDSELPTADLAAYLQNEATYETNKKKLIMNHFINLIHAQFKGSILSYTPQASEDTAVALGKIFIQNDCGIDLESFTKAQTDPAIIDQQAEYINILRIYYDFFQTYTSYLSKLEKTGSNQYYTLAQNYKNINHLTMNPSMFFYDIESMRAIESIPFISSTLSLKAKIIPWAPSIVNAAKKGLTQNNHPIAYFKDSLGAITKNIDNAQSLYILVETGPALFEEELLIQPAWMRNQNGCLKILSGCLGNMTQLVGLGIIDSTLESIINKAIGKK